MDLENKSIEKTILNSDIIPFELQPSEKNAEGSIINKNNILKEIKEEIRLKRIKL